MIFHHYVYTAVCSLLSRSNDKLSGKRDKFKPCTNVTNTQTRTQIKMTNLPFRYLREGRINLSSWCKQVQDGKWSWSQWCSTNRNLWVWLNSLHIFLLGTFGSPVAYCRMTRYTHWSTADYTVSAETVCQLFKFHEDCKHCGNHNLQKPLWRLHAL